MGGCRCTYANCSSKSGGRTHLFHYPVFEKGRCQQWLLNAGRPDLLNLTVSQLKNRVVCQHHFEDVMFMNSKKDKLIHNAVPTKDGINCVSNEKKHITDLSDLMDDLPTITRDEKKTLFPFKYVDFLSKTHDNLDLKVEPSKIKININETDNPNDMYSIIKSEVEFPESVITCLKEKNKKNVRKITNEKLNESVTSKTLIKKSKAKTTSGSIVCQSKRNPSQEQDKNKKKIMILSEQKISAPLNLKAPVKLLNIKPCYVLNQPERHKLIMENVQHDQPQHVSDVKLNCKNDGVFHLQNDGKENSLYFETLPNTDQQSQIQIESKEVCAHQDNEMNKRIDYQDTGMMLNCIDGTLQPVNVTQSYEENSENIKLKQNITVIENKQDDGICLESRLEQMEGSLLNRIDHNTQQILELKNLLLSQSLSRDPQTKQKTVSTQTVLPEDGYKKALFDDISSYLSPELNSMIYEELFINKLVSKTTCNSQRPKRKKYI